MLRHPAVHTPLRMLGIVIAAVAVPCFAIVSLELWPMLGIGRSDTAPQLIIGIWGIAGLFVGGLMNKVGNIGMALHEAGPNVTFGMLSERNRMAREQARESSQRTRRGPPVKRVVPGAKDACPRCSAKLPAADAANGERACAQGCGVLLASAGVEHLIERAQLDLAVVRALAREQGAQKNACPACATAMRETKLKGVAIDVCLSCGAAWLDTGEREQLTRADAFKQ